MPDFFKTIKVTQPNLGGPLQEALVGAVQASGGAVDAGKVVVLNASGQLDPSIATTAFSGITTGTNTTATMTVGTGGTLTFSGTGVVNASELNGVTVTNQPTHLGQIPIVSNLSPLQMNYSDPLVQGLYAAGSQINTPPPFAAPTTIQPILIGGSDYSGTPLLQNWKVDSSGIGYVSVVNSSGSAVTGGQTAVVPGVTTATWTPSTPINTALALNVVGYGTVKVTLNQGATLSGGVVMFEASDTLAGTNWFSINAGEDNASSSTPPSSSYALLPNVNQSFTIGSGAWVQIRIRLSTTITIGTVNVAIAAMAFSGGSGASGGGGGGAQYTEGSTVPTATGTVAFGKDATNVVHALKLDGSGNLDVNTQSAVFATTPGNTLPPNTVWIAASDGTNLQPLQVESSANKNLRVAIFNGTQEVATVGSALSVNVANATLSVQDVADVTAGTTTAPTKVLVVAGKTADITPAYDPIPLIAGGTAVSVKSVDNVAQGSTTAGQVGPLIQGAVATSDPSYTNAQTDPLSLTTTGHLRTQDSAETNANGSTAVPTNALFVGAKGADGFLHGLSSSTNDGKLDVNASFSGSVTTSFIADRKQAGNITSTQTVPIVTEGASSVVVNITGTWTGTIQFQLLLADNTTWTAATVYPVATGGAGVTQTNANGQWQLPCGGFPQFRAIGNTVNTGTAVVSVEAGAGTFSSFVEQLTATNLNVTVGNTVTVTVSGTPTVTANQGAPNTNTNGWPVKVTDGTNIFGVAAAHPFVTQDTSDGVVNTAVQPTTAIQAAGWDGTNLRALSTTSNGFLNVNASISGSFTPALTADATATGTITSTQNVVVSTQGTGTTLIYITGTWTGTLVFEVSIDGTNFISAKAVPKYPTGTPGVSSTTANGQWAIPTGGVNKFRVRGNTVATGTATVWLEAGAGAQDIAVFSILTDPNDGTFAVIKPASTTPVAADPALVVALSPNSAITTTTVPTTGAEALVVALSPNSSQFATSTTATTLPGTNPQTIGTSSSAIVNANANRKEITITNTGTTYIYIGLGQTPTNTSYHIALTKCGVANDGTGGTWTSDMWKGSVNGISSAVGGTVNVVELT